jgi:hypothetical protein
MNQQLPTSTPEQLEFAVRMSAHMVPLIKGGMDLLDAERAAARTTAEEMLDEGGDSAAVAALREDALSRSDSGQLIKHSDVLVSPDLQEILTASFKAAGGRRLSPVGLLVEKRLTTASGYPVYLYSNESKHPGRPHVTIVLGEERVNVTIEPNPVVLVGNKRAKGLKAAMQAVAASHAALLEEWNATRPDDQRLENFKAKRAEAAAAPKAAAKR